MRSELFTSILTSFRQAMLQAIGFSKTHLLVDAIILLFLSLCGLLLFILVYLLVVNRREHQQRIWRNKIEVFIRNAMFLEDGEELRIPKGIIRSLEIKGFRNLMIDELVLARKNFIGTAGDNMKKLYEQFNLSEDSLAKVANKAWFIKAKGIQELAEMDQKQVLETVYPLADYKNEFVRTEAQTAIVELSGAEGLTFLNFVTYPISDWQQIKLLAQLPGTLQEVLAQIENWLNSKNDSVVIFTLKLIALYHQFDLHELVLKCLAHPNPEVRLQAITTLKEIYTDETAGRLTSIYPNEPVKNQLAILSALQLTATENEIPFLLTEFGREDNRIKLEAARALLKQGDAAKSTLHYYAHTNESPWAELLQQVEGEQEK